MIIIFATKETHNKDAIKGQPKIILLVEKGAEQYICESVCNLSTTVFSSFLQSKEPRFRSKKFVLNEMLQ